MSLRLRIPEVVAKHVRICTAFYGSAGTVFGLYYRLSPVPDGETVVVCFWVLFCIVMLGLHAVYGSKGPCNLASRSFATYLVVSVALSLPLLYVGLYFAKVCGLFALMYWMTSGGVQ